MNTNELGNVKGQQSGFTLIELVVVIVIIAILAATVLPRFAELSEEAHEASVRGTAGAFGSAVALVKAQWTGVGAPGEVNDGLEGFGADNVNTNAEGWPVSVTDGASSSNCVNLWRALLQSNAPTVSASDGDDTDYVASSGTNSCTYEYQRGDTEHTIEYNAEEGEVSTSLNNS
ncbi:prepilin-type N-terminal cleavage/methylation domain-containing protein [Halospina sp. K52047b]|uniref:prepilin-type N-terminal cleavage/methylation domain-containing protein n=1 Tax=Halospina sp. K52047b TaxID=2614160 RepID=UPI00124A1922|nr:prepilin-type N-terminal cleavage/methylation domain-containing protein [Halospina sp. K52047b]KAA8982556.1 prepilin-type N-terminal cleavage/methylation domain-containing protein [Halospina sp. K52047b]